MTLYYMIDEFFVIIKPRIARGTKYRVTRHRFSPVMITKTSFTDYKKEENLVHYFDLSNRLATSSQFTTFHHALT
jgi:hypothetical protein